MSQWHGSAAAAALQAQADSPGEDLIDEMGGIYGIWDKRDGAFLPARRLAMPWWLPDWGNPWTMVGPYRAYPWEGQWFSPWYLQDLGLKKGD